MFSLDNVIDDLWPQARPAPWQKKLLKKFKARLCVSCGAVFSGDDEECNRCKAESEDARELLGL